VLIYLLMFGFTLNPYTHSVLFKLIPHQSSVMHGLISNNTSLFHQAVTLQPNFNSRIIKKSDHGNGIHSIRNNKGSTTNSNGHIPHNGTPDSNESAQSCGKEPCHLSPDTIRYEAQCLRTDFTLRMKQIIFNSLISAYYVGFIPLKFTQVSFLKQSSTSSSLCIQSTAKKITGSERGSTGI